VAGCLCRCGSFVGKHHNNKGFIREQGTMLPRESIAHGAALAIKPTAPSHRSRVGGAARSERDNPHSRKSGRFTNLHKGL
jgi:hypothetical protein